MDYRVKCRNWKMECTGVLWALCLIQTIKTTMKISNCKDQEHHLYYERVCVCFKLL